MSRKPRLLDLFCGAGGCSVGYTHAGFDVVGVDLDVQPRYPFFEIIQGDALAVLDDLDYVRSFDAVHASPPCQLYTVAGTIHGREAYNYPDLVEPVRKRLEASGRPYVIENVVGAPLTSPAMLCGQAFGLGVFRHRLFETNWPLTVPAHTRHNGRVGDGTYFTVAGHGYGSSVRDGIALGGHEDWQRAMGIAWMSMAELAQAIPPAYTEFVGRQLMDVMAHAVA